MYQGNFFKKLLLKWLLTPKNLKLVYFHRILEIKPLLAKCFCKAVYFLVEAEFNCMERTAIAVQKRNSMLP